jgi:hypothetical protein
MDAHLSKPDFSYLKPPPEVVKLIQHDGIKFKEV